MSSELRGAIQPKSARTSIARGFPIVRAIEDAKKSLVATWRNLALEADDDNAARIKAASEEWAEQKMVEIVIGLR